MRNATLTHLRQILGSESGNPTTWNDKTIVSCDKLTRGAHEGKLFNDYKFTLLEYDAVGEVVEQQCKGAWIMTNNGHSVW